MAVAHDAATESHTGTTGWTTTPDPFTFPHTPAGTPRGVLLFCFVNADEVGAFVSASYGGVAMTAVPGGEAVDTATEPGRCKAFFLGAGIPTGTQTVSIDHSASTAVKYAVVVTVTAAYNTQTIGTPVLLQDNGTLAEQNVDSGAGTTALRYAGLNSGLPDVPPAGANSTALLGIDFGARVVGTVREAAAGAGSRPVGFTSATSDDRAAVHLAICEITPAERSLISAVEAGGRTLQTRLLAYEAAQATAQSRQPSYETAGVVLQTRLSPLEGAAAPSRQAIGFVESLLEEQAAAVSPYGTAGAVVITRSAPWEASADVGAVLQAAAEALALLETDGPSPLEALEGAALEAGTFYGPLATIAKAEASPAEALGIAAAVQGVILETLAQAEAVLGMMAEALAGVEIEEERVFEVLLSAWQDQEAPYEFGARIAPEAAVPFEAQGAAAGVSQDATAAYEAAWAVAASSLAAFEALASLERAFVAPLEAQAAAEMRGSASYESQAPAGIFQLAEVPAEALGRISAEGLIILNSGGLVSREGLSQAEAQAQVAALAFSSWEALEGLSESLEAFAEAAGKVLRALATNYEATRGAIIGPARRRFAGEGREGLAPEMRRGFEGEGREGLAPGARQVVKALRR